MFRVSMTGAVVFWVIAATSLIAQDQEKAAEIEGLPSAAVVLENYIEAIGGEMTLQGIESMRASWKLKSTRSAPGTSIPWTIFDFAWTEEDGWGAAYRTEAGTIGSRLGIAKGKPWRQVPGSQSKWLDEKESSHTALRDYGPQSPLRWLEQIEKTKVTGIKDIDGRPAYQMLMGDGDANQVVRFFDQDTGLLVAIEIEAEGVVVNQYFTDYRDIDGFSYPHHIQFKYERFDIELQMEVEELEFNGTVDDELIAVPEELKDK